MSSTPTNLFNQAIELLHSDDPTSAEQLRKLIAQAPKPRPTPFLYLAPHSLLGLTTTNISAEQKKIPDVSPSPKPNPSSTTPKKEVNLSLPFALLLSHP